MWSIAHAQVIEAVIELNRISHISSSHQPQTAVQTPRKQFALVCSHIRTWKTQKCKENTAQSHWFLGKGRSTGDPPMLPVTTVHKCAVHHTVHPKCLNLPYVCYTALQLCVCVCVCNSHWSEAGLAVRPLVTQMHASETCWFTAHMPHRTFVHIFWTNWFATVHMLSQYSV